LQTESTGMVLDAARGRHDAAQATLAQFGSRQRQADPEGFARAVQEEREAAASVASAEQAYTGTLSPDSVGAAFGAPRRRKASAPAAAPAVAPDTGTSLEDADKAVHKTYAEASAAWRKFASFGLRQRNDDPEGFANAQREWQEKNAIYESVYRVWYGRLPAEQRGPAFTPAQP
jgi:hypothetical protein